MTAYPVRMASLPPFIPIGDLAARSGLATSTLRYYEAQGLIRADRTAGNQRRFARATLRRVAIIRAAQGMGLSLQEIREALGRLPTERTPNKADWERLSRSWQRHLDGRIDELQRLREELTDCIGCGCLSLRRCALFNRRDRIAANGPGARYLLGDPIEED